LCPIPNPQSPIPNPQSPFKFYKIYIFKIIIKISVLINLNINNFNSIKFKKIIKFNF